MKIFKILSDCHFLINNLQSQLNQIREKTIGGLKPTQTLIDLVELSQTNRETQTTALSRLNAVENKSTLFTVVNENGNELANAIINDPIPNITGFQRSSDGMNWEFLVRVNWNLSQDYIIPHSFYNNGVPLVWGPAAQEEISAKDNFNEIINELDLKSIIFGDNVYPDLTVILNTAEGKIKVAEALNNSEQIIIKDINANASDKLTFLSVEIRYFFKDGADTFLHSYIWQDFIIFVEKIGEWKPGHIAAIQAIEGVADATDAQTLQDTLNRNSAKIIINGQILFNDQLNSNLTFYNIEVTGLPGEYIIKYVPIAIYPFYKFPDLVITDFNEKG